MDSFLTDSTGMNAKITIIYISPSAGDKHKARSIFYGDDAKETQIARTKRISG